MIRSSINTVLYSTLTIRFFFWSTAFSFKPLKAYTLFCNIREARAVFASLSATKFVVRGIKTKDRDVKREMRWPISHRSPAISFNTNPDRREEMRMLESDRIWRHEIPSFDASCIAFQMARASAVSADPTKLRTTFFFRGKRIFLLTCLKSNRRQCSNTSDLTSIQPFLFVNRSWKCVKH